MGEEGEGEEGEGEEEKGEEDSVTGVDDWEVSKRGDAKGGRVKEEEEGGS